MIYKQPPPYTMKIEVTEGCTLACWFCGIQAIRDNGADWKTQTNGKASGPFRFMTVDTMERIASEVARLGWNPRWEFAGRGEPSANAKLVDIVGAVRRHLPKAYILITTNGSGLAQRPERIDALMKAGANTIALDDYQHANFVAKIKDYLDLVGTEYPVGFYPQDQQANPYHRHRGHRIVVLRDITVGGGVRNLHNQGGSSGKPEVLHEMCAKPFREFTIRWDGQVALCCDDWPGRFQVGSVHATPLDQLWHSPQMDAARRMLIRADRGFKPCAGCTARTFRNGLLPDGMGKHKDKLGPVTEETRAILKEAVSHGVRTPKTSPSSHGNQNT